jgi:anti-repressor protein
MNIDIRKFSKEEFGTLTSITNHDTNVVMFVASEVGKAWGHTNIKQAVTRLLNPEEYKVIKKSDFPEFFKILVRNKVLPTKAQRIQLIVESGMYKLVLSSNLEKAKYFRDWVTGEVLPSIRKNGYYSIADQTQKLMIHTNHLIQKQNSKDVNAKNYIENGVRSVIDYNRKSCLLHSGKTTTEVKEAIEKATE